MDTTLAAHDSTQSDRNYPRSEVNLSVIRRSRDEIYQEFTRVISAGGMFVESPAPPEVGETLSVEFVLPGLKAPVEIRAEVVWRREPGTPDSPGMGVQFLDVEETLRQRISTFVECERNSEAS
jgi:uncharacterized protein (TIGR02266 family)